MNIDLELKMKIVSRSWNSKYGKDANLELEMENYGWRCPKGAKNV